MIHIQSRALQNEYSICKMSSSAFMVLGLLYYGNMVPSKSCLSDEFQELVKSGFWGKRKKEFLPSKWNCYSPDNKPRGEKNGYINMNRHGQLLKSLNLQTKLLQERL